MLLLFLHVHCQIFIIIVLEYLMSSLLSSSAQEMEHFIDDQSSIE